MKTLSQYMIENTMTQQETARQIGTSQANISKLCGENPHISLEMAIQIEVATGGQVPIEIWPNFALLKTRAERLASVAGGLA